MKKYMNKTAVSAASITLIAILLLTVFYRDEHDGHSYENEVYDGHDHESEERDDHDHENVAHDDHEDEHNDTVVLDDAVALKAGIKTKVASKGEIQKSIPLNGQITLNENKTAVLRSRLTGTVRTMHVNVGDNVKKGQKLATIYSNNSLSNYDLISPMNGTVVARANALGDILEGDEILTVSNLSTVWARFHVFPKDISLVKRGMNVSIKNANDGQMTQMVKLTQVFPSADIYSQSVIAIAEVDNAKGSWKPGLNLNANAYTETRQVEVAVPQKALHVYEDNQVVFIKEGGEYKPVPVTLGKQDEAYAEIIEGLAPKQTYVAEGSYVIKAELLKSTAAHNH